MSEDLECWICDSADVVYTDVLGGRWCREHFNEFYLMDDA